MQKIVSSCLLLATALVVPTTSASFVPHHRANAQRKAYRFPGHKPSFPSTSLVSSVSSRIHGLPKSRIHGLPQQIANYFDVSGIELADLYYDNTGTAFDAWEWTANMGAPAALVAGAVLVTLGETRENTAPRKNDKRKVRLLKQSMRFLLLTSFALEVVSIFVGTMLGSNLLGRGACSARKAVGYGSPLQLLHHHHEFEYLVTQICFLQGLLHWLAAVGCELKLPKKGESRSARRMNKCSASWLTSLMIWIIAFYNNHLNFYSNYLSMLKRCFSLFLQRYVFMSPFRPLSLIYVPSFFWSSVLTWRAFKSPPELDEDDEE